MTSRITWYTRKRVDIDPFDGDFVRRPAHVTQNDNGPTMQKHQGVSFIPGHGVAYLLIHALNPEDLQPPLFSLYQ